MKTKLAARPSLAGFPVVFAAMSAISASALSACSSTSTSTSATPARNDAPDAASTERATPQTFAGARFAEPAEWAAPIADYIAGGKRVRREFDTSINDLVPFGERLFIGYGDANYNLGTKSAPIEIRAFSSPDDPAALALTIEGAGQGEAQKTPTGSGEEQIDRYRVFDGELWQAGIDSTDPDELWTQSRTDPKRIEGNVYRLDRPNADVVQKRRSIPGGEHVHDVASFGGAVYAVGSGADTRIEFEAGQVFRYLWRSNDRGASFQTVQRFECSAKANSDTRFVHLLSTKSALFVFGYETIFSTNRGTPINAKYDGQSLSDITKEDLLGRLVPDGTLPLPDGSGLVWGQEIGKGETTLRVNVDGAVAPLEGITGANVLDASLTDTSEVLFLVSPGARSATPPTTWNVRVLVLDVKSLSVTPLLELSLPVRPASIAAFKGALFLGTADGRVLKSVRN